MLECADGADRTGAWIPTANFLAKPATKKMHLKGQLWQRAGVLLIALACLVVPAEQTWAEKASGRQGERRGLNPDQAAGIVRRETGGRVLGVRPSGGGGYDVKVLTPKGRVSVRRVEGRGGNVDR